MPRTSRLRHRRGTSVARNLRSCGLPRLACYRGGFWTPGAEPVSTTSAGPATPVATAREPEPIPAVVGQMWATTDVTIRSGPSAGQDRIGNLEALTRVGITGVTTVVHTVGCDRGSGAQRAARRHSPSARAASSAASSAAIRFCRRPRGTHDHPVKQSVPRVPIDALPPLAAWPQVLRMVASQARAVSGPNPGLSSNSAGAMSSTAQPLAKLSLISSWRTRRGPWLPGWRSLKHIR